MKYVAEVVLTIEAQDEIDAGELAWEIIQKLPLGDDGLVATQLVRVD